MAGVRELLNFQEAGGMADPYLVKLPGNIIKRHSLPEWMPVRLPGEKSHLRPRSRNTAKQYTRLKNPSSHKRFIFPREI